MTFAKITTAVLSLTRRRKVRHWYDWRRYETQPYT